jgi:pSer/pThr/pTyr-binding forkhead associated (FHA) protein
MSSRITLTVLSGIDPGKVHTYIDACRVVVGRADDCSIRVPKSLANVDISRHHCEFLIDPPAVRVRDLGSLIGTFLNGVLIGKRSSRDRTGSDTHFPVQPPRELRDGDKVQVGHSLFRVGIHASEGARSSVPAGTV